MSMEEEQARQAAAAQAQTSAAPATAPAATVPAEPTDEEEEAMLKQALAMSEGHDVEMTEHGGNEDELSEEEQIARAIEMSMKQEQEQEKK